MLIEPRADLDVWMVAPQRAPATQSAANYQKGGGVPCLVGRVYQNASGNALDLALSYASAVGGGRSASSKPNFKEESRNRPGSVSRPYSAAASRISSRPVLKRWFEAGYAPGNAYFECLHENQADVDAHLMRAASPICATRSPTPPNMAIT